MFPRPVLTLAALVLASSPLLAANPGPSLGKKGKLLLEEKFEAPAIPAGWNKNTGELTVRDGALHARELEADKHVAAFRKALPLQDCVVQVDVKLEGPATFHLGFDPAKGALDKKGHLFSLIIAPTAWSITEHVNKADPKSKNQIRARAATTFPRGEWFTVTLEVKGNDVIAHIAGKEPLRATAKDFHVKKPGLVFRVGGKSEHAAAIDNLRVWELK